MDFRQKFRAGACISAIGFGVGVEVVATHAAVCRQYGKDVVVCGARREAILPPHTHTEFGTPGVVNAATVFASTSVGTTHEMRLEESLSLSDGEVGPKLV